MREALTSQMLNPTSLGLLSETATPSALMTCANRTSATLLPSSSSQPQSRNSATRQLIPSSHAVVLMAGTSAAPSPDRILVMHCESITMAILRVAASRCRALMMCCTIGDLRAMGLGAVKVSGGSREEGQDAYRRVSW